MNGESNQRKEQIRKSNQFSLISFSMLTICIYFVMLSSFINGYRSALEIVINLIMTLRI